MSFSIGSSGIIGSSGCGCSLEELLSGTELVLSGLSLDKLLSVVDTLEEVLSGDETLEELFSVVDALEKTLSGVEVLEKLLAVVELPVETDVLELREELLTVLEDEPLTSTLITLAPPEVSGVFLHPVSPAHINSDSAAAKNLNFLFIFTIQLFLISSSMTAPA